MGARLPGPRADSRRGPETPAPEGFEEFGPVDVDALAATPFRPDTSKTNASSIAFLFEFDGRRILFTGDGDDPRIVESLRPIARAEGGRLRLDALKVPHHGSAANISRELLELIDCPRYLISTNGERHGHPDPVAMARILVHGGESKELVFNYRRAAALGSPRVPGEVRVHSPDRSGGGGRHGHDYVAGMTVSWASPRG